ncbi:MAG: hypothetical protein NT141_04045, partial [candidate division WWE3 bacterium]|nr:hypothetical protein [candidate division WWE3 bacterium]
MLKHLPHNFALMIVFLGLLALPFFTFGLVKKGVTSTASVLSASTEYNNLLKYGRTINPVLLQEVRAMALNNQVASYSDVLKVTNETPVFKTYRLSILSESSVATASAGVKSNWSFSNGQSVIGLNPNQSASVNLTVTST